MEAIQQIKDKLYGKYAGDGIEAQGSRALVDTSILYVQKKIAEKEKVKKVVGGKTIEEWKPRYNFAPDFLLQTIAECVDNGFALDGINYVLTGNRMYMPTYKAFKNKIYMVYPESEIDVQIVRESDTFSFAKESGSVMYSHQINDPFEDKPIIGAYCVIKNKRGEFLEVLNKRDYDEMKKGSKTPGTWEKWPSEFWRKSVIKRACKTHFNDITSSLEEQDNELTGLADVVKAPEDKKAAIIAANKPAAPAKPKKAAKAKDVSQSSRG